MKKSFCTGLILTFFISLSFSQIECMYEINDLFIQEDANQNDNNRNKYSGDINQEYTKDLKSFSGDSIFIEYSYLFDFCNYAEVRFIGKSRMMGIANKIQNYNYELFFNDIPISYSRIKVTEVNGVIYSITCRSELETLTSVNNIDFSIIDQQVDWFVPVNNHLISVIDSLFDSTIDSVSITSESFEVQYSNELEMYRLVKVLKVKIDNMPYKMKFDVTNLECIHLKNLTNY